jgi:uncharacterized protein YjbJ (UPF0337 family)
VSILEKIRHKAQTAEGKPKKSSGRVTGSRRLGTKGRAEKAVDDLKHATDKVKAAIKH